MIYKNLKKQTKEENSTQVAYNKIKTGELKMNIHFVDGAFVELFSDNDDDYVVEFIKDKDNSVDEFIPEN